MLSKTSDIVILFCEQEIVGAVEHHIEVFSTTKSAVKRRDEDIALCKRIFGETTQTVFSIKDGTAIHLEADGVSITWEVRVLKVQE